MAKLTGIVRAGDVTANGRTDITDIAEAAMLASQLEVYLGALKLYVMGKSPAPAPLKITIEIL